MQNVEKLHQLGRRSRFVFLSDKRLCKRPPGSLTSLVAGLLFGLLAAVGSYQTSQNPRNVWLSLATAGTLAAVMGFRFLNSWKFMPAGLMTLASALMLVKIITGMLKTRPHKT
ncbi:transmembrane protein 14C-like isoform X1 [Acanthochromis polyacanthus]|uniref:transmembrane protein 14C-like isoform X1 n=1 Tax=Acanthochromis polyacanthus TaxID=80966 RepID=UPI0022342946|nr:transmembrane protein 14C-like isoform X1 [Acanthochromis polyacanthus]